MPLPVGCTASATLLVLTAGLLSVGCRRAWPEADTGAQPSDAGDASEGTSLAPGTGDGARGAEPDGASGSASETGTASPEAGALNAGPEAGSPPGDAPVTPRTYRASGDIFPNPERGFYRTADLVRDRDFADLRKEGYTLVYSTVRLDNYRQADLPADFLARVAEGFAGARRAGMKVILRFAYNDGPYPNPEPDASKMWVLRHLVQLRPLLHENEDVIAVMQAGFVGAWGEWHSSTNNLTAPATAREILEGLLASLPPSRMTQLRTPRAKQELYGTAPLTMTAAFTATPAARIGHHNDCFLASEIDQGTYDEGKLDAQKAYLAAETRFLPMGGETCGVNPPRSQCAVALKEMEQLHYTFINQEYHPDVVKGWATGGCRETMERRLGYRLALTKATLPPAARPGGTFVVEATVQNGGWAAPINPRPVVLVLAGANGQRQEVTLGLDVRRLLPGEHVVRAHLALPSTLPLGQYRLSLWLPDASPGLRARPEYALRLANADILDAASGAHLLGTIDVTADAPGSARAGTATFTILRD